MLRAQQQQKQPQWHINKAICYATTVSSCFFVDVAQLLYLAHTNGMHKTNVLIKHQNVNRKKHILITSKSTVILCAVLCQCVWSIRSIQRGAGNESEIRLKTHIKPRCNCFLLRRQQHKNITQRKYPFPFHVHAYAMWWQDSSAAHCCRTCISYVQQPVDFLRIH